MNDSMINNHVSERIQRIRGTPMEPFWFGDGFEVIEDTLQDLEHILEWELYVGLEDNELDD